MKTTKADKILILAFFVLTLFSFNIRSLFGGAGDTAHVYLDGKLLYKIDLSSDINCDIPLSSGTAKVKVSGGKLYMTDSPCPRKICVNSSPIYKKGDSIVCVPNRIAIRIIGDDENGLDTITK